MSVAKRDWSLCGWCWSPLPGQVTWRGGVPYCDEVCAGRELDVAVVLSLDGEQLSLEGSA